MKKFWSFVLAIIVVMSLTCGCAKSTDSSEKEPVPATQTDTNKPSTYYNTPENLEKVNSLVYEYLGNGTYVETDFDNTLNLYTVALAMNVTYDDLTNYALDAQYNDICRQFQEILGCDVMIGVVNSQNEVVFASVNGVDVTFEN